LPGHDGLQRPLQFERRGFSFLFDFRDLLLNDADVFLDRLTGGLHHRLISGALPGLGRLVTPKTYVALKTTLWP